MKYDKSIPRFKKKCQGKSEQDIRLDFQRPENAVHSPNCDCPCGPVNDSQLREFSNGTLHVYRYCRSCGTRATSPVKRESIPLQKWQDFLIASGHIQEARHG